MSALIIIRIEVLNPSELKNYQDIAPGIIDKYKGKLVVRGGELISLEGLEEKRRIVVLEFPSLEEAKTFYYSDEYEKAIKLRKDVANFEMIAIDCIN